MRFLHILKKISKLFYAPGSIEQKEKCIRNEQRRAYVRRKSGEKTTTASDTSRPQDHALF
jgi:hypothetical protein